MNKRRFTTRELQIKTMRKAHRLGAKWESDEVARLVEGIKRDETTYEIAMALGRSYYGIQTARSHVRFALNHIEVFK